MARIAAAALVTGLAAVAALTGCGGPPLDELLPPFRAELARLADEAERADRIDVPAVDGWFFFGPELRHVSAGVFWGPAAAAVSRARRPEEADPTAAILDLAAQLDRLGVELMLVPVPPKAIIFPEKVSAALTVPVPVPRLDPDHQAFYDRLRDEGVDVLDLTRLFIRERFHPEGPLYCRTDTHWSGTGCTVAAAAIAQEVRERSWFGTLETRPVGVTWYSTTVSGDLVARDPAAPREELRLRGVVTATPAGPGPPAPDPDSPIVLLGDSHTLVFHAGDDLHAEGAGLADQLAFELGMPVDLVATRGGTGGSSRMLLRQRAEATPGYWGRKRLVIWCFAARAFTEGDGWPLVPIAP